MNTALKQVEAGLPWVTPELIERTAGYVVDGYRSLLGTHYAGRGDDPDYLQERLNSDFDAGLLPGIEQPQLDRAGRELEMKRRAYAISEIELLLTLPGVQHAIQVLRDLRAEEAQADKRERNVSQLAAARRRQAQQAEWRASPYMYEALVAQRKAIDQLVARVDAQSVGAGLHIELPEPLNEFEG